MSTFISSPKFVKREAHLDLTRWVSMKFENPLDRMRNQGYTIDTSENFDEKDNLNRLSFFLVLDNYFFAIVCRFLCGFKSKAFAKISSGMKKT